MIRFLPPGFQMIRFLPLVLTLLLPTFLIAAPPPEPALLSAALADRFRVSGDLEIHRKWIDRVKGLYDLKTSRAVHGDVFLHEKILKETASRIRQNPFHAFALLDVKLRRPDLEEPPRSSVEAVLDAIEKLLREAEARRRQAFSRLTPEERAHVLRQAPELLTSLEKHIYLDLDAPRLPGNAKLIQLGKKIDYTALAEAAHLLYLAASGPMIDSLLAALEADRDLDPDADVVVQRDTDLGRILIAGRGDNRHRGRRIRKNQRVLETKIAFLLDLGGDDVYTRSAGGARDGISLFLDLAGNDIYDTWEDFSQACGLLGVGILIDRGDGDDSYTADKAAQGAGFFGVGLLQDEGGNDRYRAQKFSQGFGAWGLGSLVDLGGDDRYSALEFAQAAALPHAVALLHDAGGSDDYVVKGPRPTTYGDGGLVDSFGQGSALGFRKPNGQIYAAGGIALFLDDGGADRLEAGHFSQGAGYVCGWGACLNAGTDDDRYIGSRYNLGAAAHQASGTFIDEGGNDRYLTLQSVICGAAIDTSSVLFLDEGGDDLYQAGGTSLGASQFGSACLFLDLQGRDDYRGCIPGVSSHPENSPNWSLFVDAGGDDDLYQREGRNDAVWRSRKHSFFLDLDRDLPAALREGSWKKLVTDPPE